MEGVFYISNVFSVICIAKYNDWIDVIPNTIESAVLESELHNKMTRETILRSKFANFENNYSIV